MGQSAANDVLGRDGAISEHINFRSMTPWIGLYRAIGRFMGGEFVWEWIGSHADYDKRF